MRSIKWEWPQVDLKSGGADGSAMSKLFRGGELSDTALLAREAIQNSNDAHARFSEIHSNLDFRVVFRFVELSGREKERFVKALDLAGMAKQRAKYGKDPLQPGTCLDSLSELTKPLRLLYVEDYGTHGLYGHPGIYARSHMYQAMYAIGSSDKAADAGGSFGFGKSALERASRIHSVLVHSAFEEFENDPTRTRLLGFTWWPNLQVSDIMYNGRGQYAFCDENDTGALPFDDSVADQLAKALGFPARDPNQTNDLGTSFLIVDPAIDPENLTSEIERWWWPALEEHRIDAQVILPNGEKLVPQPAANPFVNQFLRPFRIASKIDSPSDPNKERLASKTWRNRGAGGSDLGALALVLTDDAVDLNGNEGEAAPLVALMRTPHMIIRYDTIGRRRMPIRGVFIASDKVNSLLRDTEPSSHDRWTTNAAGDLSKEATDTASAVMTKIRRSVAEMMKEITPPPPRTNRALSHFSRIMRGFIGHAPGGASADRVGEKIEITFPSGRPEPQVCDDSGSVRVSSQFKVGVLGSSEFSECEVEVTCRLYVYEDETQSQETIELSLKPDRDDFVVGEGGRWVGRIAKDRKVTFYVTSVPYPNLWTTSLQPIVTRVGEWS